MEISDSENPSFISGRASDLKGDSKIVQLEDSLVKFHQK